MLNILCLLSLFFIVDAGNNNYVPYQVSLYTEFNNTTEGCAGTLISTNFVLTTASCVVKKISGTNRVINEYPKQITVFFGLSNLYSEENNPYSYAITVDKTGILAHPLFRVFYHDIALIKLPVPAILNPQVQLAYLPPINWNTDYLVGQELFSTRWSYMGNDTNKRPTELEYMKTQIVPDSECIHPTINQFNNDVNICINDANRRIWKGDAGGPNVIFTQFPILIGITSHRTFSKDKSPVVLCTPGLPFILTRVSYYLPWIHRHTGIPIY